MYEICMKYIKKVSKKYQRYMKKIFSHISLTQEKFS
jgi:hypothetical protein